MASALAWTIGTGVATIAVVFAVAWLVSRRELSGTRIVHCPGTGLSAALHLERNRSALFGAVGRRMPVRISDCSRWPQAAACARACASEVEQHPEGTRLGRQIDAWFGERSCSRCGTPLEPLRHRHDKPVLLAPNGARFHWGDLPADWLAEALEGWPALCPDCDRKA